MRETLTKDYRIVSSEEGADIYIINTCTVTNRADQKSRQKIRNIIRKNPEAFVAVTGCYAQRKPFEIARIQGVDLILGNGEKIGITSFLNGGEKNSRPEIFVKNIDSCSRYITLKVTSHQSHSRAFVKIQDGCQNYCSYCIIPYVRGKERSRPIENILEEIGGLVRNGFKEIVFTGIRLGSWGQDLNIRVALAVLLEKVSEIKDLKRIRLSSIEPRDLNEELIDRIAQLPKVCPHLHIPLQSGDDKILKAMNRPYATFYYRDLIEKIREKMKGVTITTDIMVGFPGEKKEEFEDTYDFAKKMKFAKMHVFRYSPRPGTLAAQLKGKVGEQEIKERSERLLGLSLKMQEEFSRLFLGKTLEVLVEKRRRNNYLTGLTDNYIRVAFNGPENLVNEIVKVKIGEIKKKYVIGKLDCSPVCRSN
jgi:threonylcarbamoyladenosine tRNA methylthiotransferase MtaB